MRSRFLVSLFALGVGLGGASASARDVPFAKVKDWGISRQGEGATPQCVMARAYKDADDENASSVVIATAPGQVVISLGYQGWSHDKAGRTVVLLAGGKVVDLRSKWQADDTQMTGEFSDALLTHLLGAETIVLRFKDGDADFKIPAFTEAFETLKRCNGEPQPAVVATAMPAEARIANYASGLYFQKALRECDVASTNRQRAELDGKLAGMRPEMTPVQALIEIEIDKRAADTKTPFCPKPEKAAAFSAAIDQYLTLSPEGFAAETARREAETAAGTRPSETRIKVYGMGLIFQKLMATCEIPTTARQRTEFEAKLASLTPEMVPLRDEIRAKLHPTFVRPVPELCAAFGDLSADAQPIAVFASRTPEDFAAFMDARTAATSADTSAAQPADAPASGAKL